MKDCKLATLICLHEKDTTTDSEYFSPISHLPFLSKIIEKVIHDQTINYHFLDSIHGIPLSHV